MFGGDEQGVLGIEEDGDGGQGEDGGDGEDYGGYGCFGDGVGFVGMYSLFSFLSQSWSMADLWVFGQLRYQSSFRNYQPR